MRYIADLHLHSHYARATAREMNALDLYKWAQLKGIDIIGTGDFTHPGYFSELCDQLELVGEGVYTLKKAVREPYVQVLPFRREPVLICTTELSCIYSKGGKTRRVHVLIWAPSLEVVGKINENLGKIGNLKSDGRPILGCDVKEIAQRVWDVDERCVVVPAHIWTPWFSVFGSKSGFDSLQECFEELAPRITAVETGLSSDPIMNAQVEALGALNLISNSDAHSPGNLGREATVLELDEVSFDAVAQAMRARVPDARKGDAHDGDAHAHGKREHGKNYIASTIEFFPEHGRYHWDGHRACDVLLSPHESKKLHHVCPKCHTPLTIGVESRVIELAGDSPSDRAPKKFISAVPLVEIIAQSVQVGVKSKKVAALYHQMLQAFGPELRITSDVSTDDMRAKGFNEIAEGIERVRARDIKVVPGYDGEYGVVDVFGTRPLQRLEQVSLF